MEINDQRPEWLKSLAEKTWNLELIISGAATYMSSHLPRIVDDAFYFFLDNLNREQDIRKSTLPLLAYCFAKVIAWVLPAAFLSHFIMRAFWAGLVGLHTVFPAGIDYDNLPGYRGVSRPIFEENFGTLAGYIAQLDRKCNQMFAFAFTIVLFALGLSIVYLFIFVFTNLIPQLFGEAWRSSGNTVINIAFFLLAMSLVISQQILKRINAGNHPKLVNLLSKVVLFVPHFMLPFIYRSVSYLTMTFSSNINVRKFYGRLGLVAGLIMIAFTLVFMNTILSIRSNNPYVFQSFFGQYRNDYTISSNHYNAQITGNRHPAAVTIPDEIVEGPFLKIFVAYPKTWDQTLQQICVLPELPESMGKNQKRNHLDSIRIECITNAVRLTINDSLYRRPDWQFSIHPTGDFPGVQAMISTQHFLQGKNIITVQFPSADKLDSLMTVDRVPFWFQK